jgi:hypothetical protein
MQSNPRLSGLVKRKIALKDKRIHLEKKKGENVIIYLVLIKINKNISLQKFLPLSEDRIQGPLFPAQANLGYFLAWFQSLQLPSTQPESPLAPKSRVSF